MKEIRLAILLKFFEELPGTVDEVKAMQIL